LDNRDVKIGGEALEEAMMSGASEGGATAAVDVSS
jgi:hypothetical protein